MADIIQLRRDSAANWTAEDPVLAQGEMGWETDTGKVKIGNGTDEWSVLTYGGIVGPDGEPGPEGPQGPTGPAGPVDIEQNLQNSSYTLVLTDRGKHVISTNNTNYTWTVPPESSVAFPNGSAITFVHDGTAGSKTVTQGSGVTIIRNTSVGNISLTAGQVVTLLKVGTDRWRAV